MKNQLRRAIPAFEKMESEPLNSKHELIVGGYVKTFGNNSQH